MAEFIKQIRFLFSFVFAFLALFFVLQLVSSTISIFSVTYNLNHIFGYVTLSFLIIAYFALLAIPLNFILRMPKALVPPANQNSMEFELYIEKLKKRLSTNKYLKSFPLNSRDDIETAYICLDAEANKQIRSAAAVVFFGTGVSQNGKFDAVIVVITQISLIWRIAYIYNQRPSLREVAKLYVNVFSCAFVSSSIDGMVDSAADAALGVGGSVFSSLYSKVAGSLADGSINALMSLRLGVITRRTFNPFEVKTKAEIRKGASIEALAILTEIAGEKAKTAGIAVGQASMKAAVATAEASKQAVTAIGEAASKTASSVSETSKKAGVATAEASKQAVTAIGEAASKTASSVSETSKKAGVVTAEASKQAVTAIGEAASKTASSVSETSKKVGVATVEASKQAANAIGEAASKTASSVSETSKKAGVATAEASKQAASAIGEAASKTASSVGETSKRVADFVKSAVNKPKS